ncbi:acylphosphatase [Roseimaritima sediminicola]|uniref:acylphosphatase n=1 Tax=Roseimaritima sediminicola TaxID=2662066 RepID=UPI0012983C94|nr:acylphosphatase [Roseimaritima sediminicola]
MPEAIRVKIIYQGTVQGVGFRATTAMLAEPIPVTGTVRNLPDGSVEVVAEGTRANVERLLTAIETELRHRIDTAERRESSASGQFERFRITY